MKGIINFGIYYETAITFVAVLGSAALSAFLSRKEK